MGGRGVDSIIPPPLENTLRGVRDQLFFYRIMNLCKNRQNPIMQTQSFENGALIFFLKSKFFHTLWTVKKYSIWQKSPPFLQILIFWPLVYEFKMGYYRVSRDNILKKNKIFRFWGSPPKESEIWKHQIGLNTYIWKVKNVFIHTSKHYKPF